MESEINLHFIHKTPAPIFPRLDRLHDRVLCLMEMFGSVLILRRIAAAHVAAGSTEPQVNPGVAHLEAFLAAMGSRLDIAHLIEMCASTVHTFSVS
jgi:hypothetical protein